MYPQIQIADGFVIPTYLLILSLTYSLAVVWLYIQSERRGFDRALTMDFCLSVMLGGFLGARLMHIVWEEPTHYLENPLEIFKIWQGGFVYFGGFVGAFLCSYYYAHKQQQNFGLWADFFTPIFPIGYAFGRLACFLNGCCFGRICELPWAIEGRHPAQIYAIVWELLISLPVAIITQKFLNKNPARAKKLHGLVYMNWILAHSFGRIMMEFFRNDYRGPQPLGLSVSTYISIALIIAVSLAIKNRLAK